MGAAFCAAKWGSGLEAGVHEAANGSTGPRQNQTWRYTTVIVMFIEEWMVQVTL
jgi:hypothetical protein